MVVRSAGRTAGEAPPACLLHPQEPSAGKNLRLPQLAKVLEFEKAAMDTLLDDQPRSHSHETGVCAAAPRWLLLGCDIERVEPHSNAFIADYFTAAEQALIAGAAPVLRTRLVALLWSAKESLLKALGVGLRLDTRCLSVSPDSAFSLLSLCWQPLRVRTLDARVYHGWWCEREQFVRTLVADPAPPAPPRITPVRRGYSGFRSLVMHRIEPLPIRKAYVRVTAARSRTES